MESLSPQTRPLPFQHLVLFVIIILGSIMVGSLINYLLLTFLGFDPKLLREGVIENRSVMRISLLVLHFFSFLFPALFFAWMLHRNRISKFFTFHHGIIGKSLVLGLIMLLISLPIIQYSYFLNQQIPLPHWMTQMEADATETLLNLIQMDSLGELLINLLLMALLPALGEELVFRGILQQYGYSLFKRKSISVWITALLFSAIHFQFEGFIPRFLLGLLLGYLFYWTHQILVPIIIHFANNAIMVIASYSLPAEELKIDEPMVNEIPVYLVLGAMILMVPLVGYFIRNQQDPTQEILSSNE